ncbi:MAG: HEPN domain-containing protein [Rhodocyclaceae bacterium]|nr:HEPN domain-containing protein [Rhodocyclaceae bacterium]
MTPVREEALRLLALAQADRDAFLWLIQGPGLRPATVMFSAHQAIEKALKAVMTARGLIPGRTHNLLALAAELNAAGVATPFAPDELAVLNPYAVIFRYNDEDISLLTPDQAKALVGTMLDWATQELAASPD